MCDASILLQFVHETGSPPPPPENGLDILELGYVAPLDHIVISNEKTVSTAFLNSLKLS